MSLSIATSMPSIRPNACERQQSRMRIAYPPSRDNLDDRSEIQDSERQGAHGSLAYLTQSAFVQNANRSSERRAAVDSNDAARRSFSDLFSASLAANATGGMDHRPFFTRMGRMRGRPPDRSRLRSLSYSGRGRPIRSTLASGLGRVRTQRRANYRLGTWTARHDGCGGERQNWLIVLIVNRPLEPDRTLRLGPRWCELEHFALDA
jgi:hypothetical protein